MLSKLLYNTYKCNNSLLLRKVPKKIVNVRHVDLIPPTQYDIPFPKRLTFGSLVRNNWEVLPLFFCTAVAFSIMFVHIFWAITKKVDVVYTTHNRNCISRTMDLRNPTSHKMIMINQYYEPWPEMQDVLDKMTLAEKRALVRAQACSQA